MIGKARGVVCGIELIRGMPITLCGINLESEIDWIRFPPVECLISCEHCIAEQERRWRRDENTRHDNYTSQFDFR